MPAINVTLHGTDKTKLDEARKDVQDAGGKIVKEFTIIQGFNAELPDKAVHSLKTNEHITVEEDKVVTTQ